MRHPLLYLASASPRRHDILNQLAIPHHILRVPSPDGEDEPQLPGEPPQDYVRRTALHKSRQASAWLESGGKQALDQNLYILTADTTVILNEQILGKPTDKSAAAVTLKMLSGNIHQVHTAVVLMHQGRITEAVSISAVTFKQLSDAEIHAYCETGEPMGKAGAYGIQGRAAGFVAHLSGSYTGVMGLPAYETMVLLTDAGFR